MRINTQMQQISHLNYLSPAWSIALEQLLPIDSMPALGHFEISGCKESDRVETTWRTVRLAHSISPGQRSDAAH